MGRYLTKHFFFGRGIIFILILCLVFSPLLVVLFSWLRPVDDIFIHLLKTGLPQVLADTGWLLLGVAIGTTFLGISLAWLTTRFEFPCRSFFVWAVVLPLAIPAYVLAFIYISLFDMAPSLRSIPSRYGVILVMTLALYPYVYLVASNGFHTQGTRAIEVARTMGQSPIATFFKVTLPISFPWIASGLALVLMETIADFGAVSIFNYDTLTPTIYKAWFSMFSIDAAAKFSSLLVLFIFGLIFLEQTAMMRRRYSTAERQPSPIIRIPMTGARGWLSSAYCATVLFFAFLAPVLYLARESVMSWEGNFDLRYIGFLNRSLLLSALAAVLTTVSALLLVYAGRSDQPFKTSFLIKFATLGYAIPGAVLAVGGIVLVTFIDRQFKKFNITSHLLTVTPLAMLLGYLARFLVLAHNPIASAMRRMTPNMEEAARSLGASPFRVLRAIKIPLIRGGALAGALFVFVDVMKEMPITLMTRPFGWDTLATRIFQFTSEGEWDKAAFPALILALLGILPVIFLARQSSGSYS